MSDFALIWNADRYAADLSISRNDLVAEDGLRTATILSLFVDRRADDGDVLPGGQTDRRGWWADAIPVVEGDKIGSRLWLLARAKRTTEFLRRAEEYAREALEWLLTDKIVESIEVAAEFLSDSVRGDGYGLTVKLTRPKADPVTYRFGRAWTAEEAR
jgi:phage gp46-like protein